MKKYYALALVCALNFAFTLNSKAELEVFGFLQPTLTNSNQTITQKFGVMTPVEKKNEYTSTAIQQANLMFRMDLGGKFSSFLNMEMTNNYSSKNGFGDLSLQEAFLKYNYSDALNAKIGMFIPAFNNLYEIYNRTPLLPYIYRPHIYETSNEAIFALEDYLPQKAFLQIDGSIPVTENINADYAAYFGNIENSYISTRNETTDLLLPIYGAQQRNSLQSFGGRVGLHNSMMKLGVSIANDVDNARDFAYTAIFPNTNKVLGDVARTKLGLDLNVNYEMFTLSAELISVKYNFSDTQKDSLTLWSNTYKAMAAGFNQTVPEALKIKDMNSFMKGDNWDKTFYFVALQANLTNDLFLYAFYSHLEDKSSSYLKKGDNCISFGAGFKPNENVVLKFQYQQDNADGDLAKILVKQILLGSSVSF